MDDRSEQVRLAHAGWPVQTQQSRPLWCRVGEGNRGRESGARRRRRNETVERRGRVRAHGRRKSSAAVNQVVYECAYNTSGP
jgi:hypothetical protein